MNIKCSVPSRFESKRSADTRLLYCTTGVLLRKLQQDPLLSDITHVIVDEVRAGGEGGRGWASYRVEDLMGVMNEGCVCTRLLYCKTGLLLRRLQQDPLLRDITHVIVDEVRGYGGRKGGGR